MKDVKIKISVDSKGAEKKVKSLGKEVKKTTTETGKAGGALSKGFAGLGGAIGGAIPMLGKLRAAIASTGIGAIVIAVAGLVSLFTSVGKKAAEFSQALSNLEAITGASASEMGELSDQAKELGATTAFTASEVVELQTSLSKLGFKTDDIKNATGSILDLAAALGVGLGEAAEVAGSLVKSFGLQTTDTQRIVDVMAKAASSSALGFDTIRESMKKVAPVARATGVSVEKTAALLGVLADNGVKGSAAGTGLSATFIELNKKGISLEDAMKRVTASQDPLAEAMKLTGTIGGKALLTLSSGAEGIDTLTEALENAEGAAKKQAEVQLDNVSGDVKILGSAWEGLLLSIDSGDGIISKVSRSFVQAGTSMLGFLTKTKSATDATDEIKKSLYKLEQQVKDTNTSEEDRIKLIKDFKKEHPDQLKGIDAETVSNTQLSEAIRGVNDQLIMKAALQDEESDLLEIIADAGEARGDTLRAQMKLEDQQFKASNDFKIKTIEGTEEEQAAATLAHVIRLKQSKTDAEGNKLTQKQYTELLNLEKNLVSSSETLSKAKEKEAKATGRQTEAQSKYDEMSERILGKKTKATGESTKADMDAVLANQSLIEAQEAILAIAKEMPEATEADLKAKNKAIQVIELEIKRLKELGKVKDVKKTKTETPAQKAKREAAEQKQIDAFSANTKEEARELEKTELTNQFDELYALAEGNEEAQLELTKSYLQRTAALKKKHSDEDTAEQAKIDKKKLDDAEAVADAELGIQNASLDAVGTGFSILGQLAEENKGLQAASIIGENAVGIAKNIINTNAANARLTLEGGVAAPALITANNIRMGIGIASSVAATAKGLAALGKSGGAQSPQATQGSAPSFNLVEGTESNAIQNTINGAGSKPVKAYVTSGDITTAQQADRQAELNSGF
tara:strand:- start:2658 stop:5393 length:2736 start_codon:yes stop_codon:yes gene_type:complete